MSKNNIQYLFLDRDGVINERLPGQYVQSTKDFTFRPGVLDAFPRLSKKVKRIIIVTNQQGVGKEIMTYEELEAVHEFMKAEIEKRGGRIDAIFSCTELADDSNNCRKPSPAMGLWAKMKFKEIDFSQSLMVGDSASDIEFGQALGMKTVHVEGKKEDKEAIKLLNPNYTVNKFSKILDFL